MSRFLPRCARVSLVTAALCASPSLAAFVDLPLPDIKGDGLAKLAVFNGAALNDALLWRSDADGNNNRFRVWGLDNGTYFGVTFGATDQNPGQLTAFCGFEAGRNNGQYDIANGKLQFRNREPDKIEDMAGQVLNLPSGRVKVIKGKINITSTQGEFADANKLDYFDFDFDKTQAAGPAMTHDLFAGGPVAGHPANYNAQKVNLAQGLTSANMFAAFEMGANKWNPAAVTITAINYPGGWQFEDARTTPDEQELIDYCATLQPASVAVPEPSVCGLVVGAVATITTARRRRRA